MSEVNNLKLKKRKYCAVPHCEVTSTNSPKKYFFTSPINVKMRRKWLSAMRRDYSDLSPKTRFHVCEDHFNLEKDLESYIAYKYSTGKHAHTLKPDAVPSEFTCQPDKAKVKSCERVLSKRRQMKAAVNEYLASIPSITPRSPRTEVNDELHDNDGNDGAPPPTNVEKIIPQTIDKSIQCNKKNPFRSKGIQCKIDEEVSASADQFEELLMNEDDGVSADQYKELLPVDIVYSDSDTSDTSTSTYQVSEATDSSLSNHEVDVNQLDYYSEHLREYTGIPRICSHLIGHIVNITGIERRNIIIILLKLRKNYTFSDLSHRFELTEQTVQRIFSKNVGKISETMKHFIRWPSAQQIKYTLPVAFRLNFNNVQAIIDCLEIEIQKPSNPILQALTWSDYKKGNTIKYLISCTPNGLITFISNGFGGRTSDVEIVKRSGFLDQLPARDNFYVMADRGFKGIDTILRDKGYTLVRPPSVSSGKKMTKCDARLTKQIASLRIHVERVIRRVREFKFLELHSNVHSHLIKYLDDCMIIGCGIANLQPALIKHK